MLSPERVCRNAFVALAFSLPALALAGCTLTPVYSDAAATQAKLRFHYLEPTSRLEQVVYQELALRFGGDAGEGAPRLRISVGQSVRDLTISATKPANPVDNLQVRVSGTASVVSADGSTLLLTVKRTASANYETNGQVFADREARNEAAERAARELAESLRLGLIAGLAGR
jgi:hypothetical protein